MAEMTREQLVMSHLDAARLELAMSARHQHDTKPLALERLAYHLIGALIQLTGHPAAEVYAEQMAAALAEEAERNGPAEAAEQTGEAPKVEDKQADRPRRGEKAS